MSEPRRTTRRRAVVVLAVGLGSLSVWAAGCSSAKPIPPLNTNDFGTIDRITSPSTVPGAPVTTRAPIVTTAPSTVPPITGITIPGPSTSGPTNNPVDTTVPSQPGTVLAPTTNTAPSPEDGAIFAAYRAFWDAYLWSASHPNEPRWDQLAAITTGPTLESLQGQLQAHFARGEVLRVGNGRTLNPVIVDRPEPRRVDLADCIADDTYWIVASTGEASPGEPTSLHTSYATATTYRKSEAWIVETISSRSQTCGA